MLNIVIDFAAIPAGFLADLTYRIWKVFSSSRKNPQWRQAHSYLKGFRRLRDSLQIRYHAKVIKRLRKKGVYPKTPVYIKRYLSEIGVDQERVDSIVAQCEAKVQNLLYAFKRAGHLNSAYKCVAFERLYQEFYSHMVGSVLDWTEVQASPGIGRDELIAVNSLRRELYDRESWITKFCLSLHQKCLERKPLPPCSIKPELVEFLTRRVNSAYAHLEHCVSNSIRDTRKLIKQNAHAYGQAPFMLLGEVYSFTQRDRVLSYFEDSL